MTPPVLSVLRLSLLGSDAVESVRETRAVRSAHCELICKLHQHQPMHNYIYIFTHTHTVGSRFTTIHFYDPCPVRPSTPDLWCITVATRTSFIYSVRFQVFSVVHEFLLILF